MSTWEVRFSSSGEGKVFLGLSGSHRALRKINRTQQRGRTGCGREDWRQAGEPGPKELGGLQTLVAVAEVECVAWLFQMN